MEVFKNLLDDWVGLMSLGVIVFMLLMGVFFVVTFIKKSARDD